MSSKPYALIVEDKTEWVDTFEKILKVKYEIEKAITYEEAVNFIRGKIDQIELAIVDVRLKKVKGDRSGVDILMMLKEKKIPCIATTAFFDQNAKTVRDIFVDAKAKDIWFKSKVDRKDLLKSIEGILKETKDKTESTIRLDEIRMILQPSFWVLTGITILIFGLIFLAAWLIPKDIVIALVFLGTMMIALLVTSLALFINQITGDQFKEIIKEIFLNIFKH